MVVGWRLDGVGRVNRERVIGGRGNMRENSNENVNANRVI